jgi:hypothetical protein
MCNKMQKRNLRQQQQLHKEPTSLRLHPEINFDQPEKEEVEEEEGA